MKRGLIFDLDGVLVDTEGAHEKARREIYRKYDIPLEKIRHIPVAGRNTADIFRDVNKVHSFGVPELRVPIREKREIFVELLEHGVGLLPGIRRLLDFARGKMKIGIGSSSTNSNVHRILDLTRIRDYFDVVVTAEDVLYVKPHPETYHTILRRFGLSGAQCVVLEDTAMGMRAGRDAGLTVIGVRTGHYETNYEYADMVVRAVDSGFEDTLGLIMEPEKGGGM